VIRPAAYCGVFGYKPTFGRIPASGLIPLSPSLDHVGLLGSDIDILITAAKLVVSGWKNPGGFQQPVLGIPEGPYLERVSAAGLQNFHENIRRLEAAGYQVRRVLAFPEFEKIVNRHYLIVAAEAAKVHAGWYQSFKELYHQKTADLIERGDKVKTDDLVIARKGRTHLRNSLTELMEENRIDLWISPSAPDTAPEGLESTGDPVMNLPWTQAGVPVYSIPSGVSEEGLPFGLQVIGRFGADETLTSFVREMSQVVHPTDPV
jgi:Asp-tRNA(Asn)/Glu-tRNA(Gln) amidotransferase A subunit family amidase